MLRAAGVEVSNITAIIAAVGWPWIFKFLWAPLIDILRTPRFGHRAWVVITQLVMGLTLLPLLWLKLDGEFGIAYALLLVHAIAASTQDASIDAWAIAITPTHERSKLSSSMQAGMFSARWLFGAGLLMVAGGLDNRFIVGALVCTIWSTTLLVLAAPLVGIRSGPPDGRRLAAAFRQFGAHFTRALSGRRTWLALAFALTGGLAFESVGIVVGPFLIDHHFEPPEVGLVQSLNVGAILLGLLLGGWIGDRFDRRVVVGASSLLLAAFVAVLGAIASLAPGAPPNTFAAAIILIYFAIGLFTSTSYALFMDCTDSSLGATQFSAYMGMTNACESISSLSVGRLIARLGYGPAFLVMAAAGSLALIPLLLMRRTDSPNNPKT